MIYILVPLLVCIIGAFMYVAIKPPNDTKEIGRLMFFAGLLITLWVVSTHYIHIG